jgi:peptidoglycan/LPS O-acetylase OafA/YrhL
MATRETISTPMPMPTLLVRHMPALDGIRGIAILIVMLSHFTANLNLSSVRIAPAIRFIENGWIGVDLFFALSGFLITGILFDTRGDRAYFKNFYMRRALRIFPLYYGVLVGALLIAPLVGWGGVRAGIGHAQPYYWFYGVNLLILLTGLMYPLAHFWSLAVEEHFYLVWPLVTARGSRWTLMVTCLVLMMAAFLTRILMRSHVSPIGLYVFTPCRMDALAAGALAALAARGPKGVAGVTRPATAIAATALVGLMALFVMKGGLPQFDRDVQIWGYSLLAVFFGGLIVLVAPLAPPMFLCSRWLRTFGKYSYGSYVLHPFVLGGLVRSFPSQRPGETWGYPSLGIVFYLAAGIAITQGLAFASWHIYEKPFLALKRFFAYRDNVK